jgi:hypothetical protein
VAEKYPYFAGHLPLSAEFAGKVPKVNQFKFGSDDLLFMQLPVINENSCQTQWFGC